MAVGRGAFAGPGSIAIGAGAGAGTGASLPFLVNQLSDAVAQTNDPKITARFNELIVELAGENGTLDKTKARSILDVDPDPDQNVEEVGIDAAGELRNPKGDEQRSGEGEMRLGHGGRLAES